MSIRTERVAGEIKQRISTMLQRDIDTSGFGLLTITDVIMTADLRLAKVYVSHFRSGRSNAQVLAFLDEHLKEIRMTVGRDVRLKFTPEIRFFIDESLDRAERIDALFRRIHEDETRTTGQADAEGADAAGTDADDEARA